MLKFKYNHQNNTLAYQTKEQAAENLWHQIAEEEQFTGNFASQGFNLPNGWMSFNIYEKQIKVFYKQIESDNLTDFWEPQTIVYYRKYLNKECPVIFEFSSSDEVEKVGGKWINKRGNQ